MAFIGTIAEFDERKEDFECYVERLAEFMKANKVEDDRKASVFLAVIGAEALSIVRNLFSPATPSSKT